MRGGEGMRYDLEKPLQVHIRIESERGPIGEIYEDETLEKAFRVAKKVKDFHPNAEISVEVEV